MYLLGDGIKQDYPQAQKWFLAAANQGESNAQFHLGKIYKDGLGVDKNLSLARTWLKSLLKQETHMQLKNYPR